MRLAHQEVNEEQGVREAMMAVGDSGSLHPAARPDRREVHDRQVPRPQRPGLQQMAYRVTDVEAVSAILRERGLRLLYDEPRRGTPDSRINFIHPKDAGGVLVELVEPAAAYPLRPNGVSTVTGGVAHGYPWVMSHPTQSDT